jgi:MATE family multidrug resistance protein
MSLAALSFYVVPERILGIYTRDLDVIRAGLPILFVCAWFQLFDGLQSVATGALRGLGDTRTPMLVNLVGYWMLGLPIACILAFPLRWGVVGLWIGLSIGLILVGSSLLWFWHRRSRVH